MATIGSAKRSLLERSKEGHALLVQSISVLDRRRIEAECGAGSDHALPYTFALPGSRLRMLAWMKLLAMVHTGAFPP